MDYKALAEELFHIMTRTAKLPFQKKVDDLSHGERRILGYLTFGKNGVPSGDLSEKLDLTTPRVASALNSLAKKGYIERNRDENDKRMVIVSITESGKSFMMEEYNKLISMMQKTLQKLGENDSLELIRIIKRIKEITNEMNEQECRQD
ncbi:MarR family transcriptional regulator [Neobacillus sp. CF12]|uniref:MarR family winged helix-turn-helix transcriptional regulator n=1 Tax=Neobacillus sp. CF12 TaxID=3055864 RepID=UPI0025A23BDA|nr:MarR family transcriptional regulator [Neobacillus sp. CF12]MDM5327541.1 MarR family transcriptional regulator [Neobacillus sp. CF12]